MTDTRTDAEKIRAIAAGFPVPIPAGMVDAAITSGQAVDVFAIAAADYAAAGRAKLSHEAEVTAVVARILGHAPSAYSTPVKEPVPDTRTEDEVVADILRDGVPERERRT